jgi:hypothetical protein
VSAAGAEVAFAVVGEAGVVADVDGMIEAMLKLGAEVEAVEAGKIGRMVEDAEGQFDGTGTADADAEEMAGLFLDELANSGCHVVEDGLGAVIETSGKAEVVESLAQGSDGGDAEVGTSEVNADGEGLHDEG